MSWRDYPDAPKVITSVLIKGNQEAQSQKEIGRHYIASFADGGRGCEPRNTGGFQKLQKEREQIHL